MKISEVFGKAKAVYTARFGDTLKFLLVELCMLAACLTPCLLLFRQELSPWALAAVPLYLLVMLWARMNAACTMQDAMDGASLCSLQLADPADYGKKLLYGLSRGLFLLLWSVPLIVCLVIARAHISGEMDGFTLMRLIRDFGGGDLIRGGIFLLLILLGALLLVAFGCAFHSGDRHAAARGNRKLVRGHHGKILVIWLCGIVTVIPFLIALGAAVVRYLPVLSNPDDLLFGKISLPDTKTTLIILGVGAVLTLPLLPLRSLLTAAYVHSLRGTDQAE